MPYQLNKNTRYERTFKLEDTQTKTPKYIYKPSKIDWKHDKNGVNK